MVDLPLASKDLCTVQLQPNLQLQPHCTHRYYAIGVNNHHQHKRQKRQRITMQTTVSRFEKKSMLKLWTEWLKDCWDLLHGTALICVKSQLRRFRRNLVAAPVKSHFKVLLMAFSWYHHHHHHDRQQHHDDFQKPRSTPTTKSTQPPATLALQAAPCLLL